MPVRPIEPVLQPASFSVPELLAPAGNIEMLRVALACGADAVYIGLDEGFNARARADNFNLSNIRDVVDEVHTAGARLFVTMNTLIFERELETVAHVVERLAAAGVDALIVQDPAVCIIARAVSADIELHASTQMTISSVEGIDFAASLGCCKVVVPREHSLSEIAALREARDMELEVFVHGALCVSWSGQCLSSEAWGGRSANRGQCAQACRMPYELLVDGEVGPIDGAQYLLSPRDLAGHRAVPKLMELGVETLKIEGRLKSPEYVETAVRSFRNWIDNISAEQGESARAQKTLREDLRDASVAYSRGFSDGFFGGSDHQLLVDGRFPRDRGYQLGEVERVEGKDVHVRRHAPQVLPSPKSRRHTLLSPLPEVGARGDRADFLQVGTLTPERGMGVVFDAGNPQDPNEPGGPVFDVKATRPGWVLSFGTPGPDLKRVNPGDRVWVTSSPRITARARKAMAGGTTAQRPLNFTVSGKEGEPLRVEARWRKHSAVTQSVSTLEPAKSSGIDLALLNDKLGALGGTPFTASSWDTSGLDDDMYLPVRELKQIRRNLVDELLPRVAESARRTTKSADLNALRDAARARAPGARSGSDAVVPRTSPQLIPLCRTMEQLEAAIRSGVTAVELDWMEMVGLGKAFELAREAGVETIVATTRVQKPGERGFDKRIERLEPDAVLVRHWGALMHFAETEQPDGGGSVPVVHGDFSLNVTNSITANELLARGLASVTAAHDLDRTQLLALLQEVDPARVTVALHHHIPTFHTEHCVYAATLSDGLDYRTCGRPCEEHRVALRDHKGLEHPVIVDVGCRNTVFNARAQSCASLVPHLLSLGVKRFRVEFTWEGPEEAERVLRAYRSLLDGDAEPSAVLETLSVHEQFGLTMGTMEVTHH